MLDSVKRERMLLVGAANAVGSFQAMAPRI